MDALETLWADLLSAEAIRIRRAWDSLAADEHLAVRAHLTRMRDEPGWHPAQQAAAAAALRVIHGAPPD